MPFTEPGSPLAPRHGRALLASLTAALVLAGCASGPRAPAPATAPSAAPGPAEQADAGSERARDWADYKRRAALRMVQANPGRSYLGEVPDPLLAIPVLEIELDAAGGVRRMAVLRVPTQAQDTMKLAMDAVRRAAPFGPVDHLPGPWKFTEIFLFDDARRFKPRTLDE